MVEIIYPTIEKIVEYNILALKLINVKRADKPKILSNQKIVHIIDETKATEGDIYDKAVVLLKGLIQKHPFASGNRRTAFIVTKEFLIINQKEFNIEDDPIQARAMQGIRENYYTNNEIKEWIKNGKIREFKRS
jgi:death-on-curing family protein